MRHYEVHNYKTNELIKRFDTESEALAFMKQLKKENEEKNGRNLYCIFITLY